MNDVDFESIEYIYATPKLNCWRYGINTIDELSTIKQDDLVKLICKIGIFNNNVFQDILSHHQSFIFIHETNSVTPLLFGEDLTEEDIKNLLWKEKPKNKTLREKFTSLFENLIK